MRHNFFKFLFFFFCIFGFSQEKPPVSVEKVDTLLHHTSETINADSLLKKIYISDNQVYSKNFNDKFQSKYKGAEYDYTTIKPHESLWERLMRYVRNILRSIFGDADAQKANVYTETVLRIGAILLVAIILYFLIRYLLQKEGAWFFGKKNKNLNLHEEDLQENIHEIDFSQKIAQHEQEKDFRSAVRYRFLQVLKRLSDQNKIEWNPEKTNQDYISELKNDAEKASFRSLVQIFNYVWYGEFGISENDYQSLRQNFQNADFR